MNNIWGIMILTGILYGTLTGNIDAISEAVLTSSKEAVSLCITMLGVMALWMGLMEIARSAGLVQSISRRIRPLVRFLFPRIPDNHPAAEHITLNFVANILGLGWAATPAGLAAMESLAELEEERREQCGDTGQSVQKGGSGEIEEEVRGMQIRRLRKTETGKQKKQRPGDEKVMPRGVASNEMCTFLILNISSLQLIPVNIIAYRSQYGSVNPTAIVGPGIVATAVSTGVAIVFCKVMDKRKRRA